MSIKADGHFAAKHPAGTQVAPEIRQAVQTKLIDQGITCAAAHEIATALGVSPAEVGVAIDLEEGRILKCQLGLFGFGKSKKKVKPAQSVAPALRTQLLATAIDQRLACAEAWYIAQTAGLPRMAVANACEVLNIRIKPCQLGAFKRHEAIDADVGV